MPIISYCEYIYSTIVYVFSSRLKIKFPPNLDYKLDNLMIP